MSAKVDTPFFNGLSMPRSMFGCFVKAQSDLDWAFSYGADSHKPKLKI
jgi:hypothetical protein